MQAFYVANLSQCYEHIAPDCFNECGLMKGSDKADLKALIMHITQTHFRRTDGSEV